MTQKIIGEEHSISSNMQPHRLSARFYVIFTLVTLFPSAWLAHKLEEILSSLPQGVWKQLADWGVIEAPTAVLIILLIIWSYESFFWRVWPISKIHRVPNVNGRYEGSVKSVHGENSPIVLEIRQSMSDIKVCLYSERSASYSTVAYMGKNECDNHALHYAYRNQPRTVELDKDMRVHEGFAVLQINNENSLSGYYYNDSRERPTHGVIECARTSKNLLGRFKK